MERSKARVLATWPAGTFIENVYAEVDGSILVSVHSAGEIQRWRGDREISTLVKLPASPTSMNAHPDGGLVVLGGTVGSSPQFAWHVTSAGRMSPIVAVDGALFFNGSTPFRRNHLLAVDAILGRIYDIDLRARSASVWFDHDLLRKVTAEPMLPGANGIKIFGRYVYVSNTDRALFLRIPFDSEGTPGEIESVAERLRADDFAFDRSGNAFLTTHIHNSILRLTPAGARINVAGVDDGMAGSTAATFGVTPETSSSLFVTTTGGVLAPYNGIRQQAKLIQVDVGADGAPVTYLG